MPEEPVAKKLTCSAGAAAGDAFAALPDEILQHVLSFLPAQLAVRTCVLARRWRRLWEGAAGLRTTAANAPKPMCLLEDLVSSTELREFVDHLFLLRGGALLDSCEFNFDVRDDADVPHVNLWIRHAVRCQVRRLELSITRMADPRGFHFHVDNLPLVSKHLRRLDLDHTGFNCSFLDLSGCPGLEDLYIKNGFFGHAKRISSKSVKHLTVINSFFNKQVRTILDVPSVVSLQLEDPWDRTPALGNMPLLAVAFIRFGPHCLSSDQCYNSESGDCEDEHCLGCYGLEGDNFYGSTANVANKNKSVLLNGLSEAKSLVLIDKSQTFIFKQDVKWCPVFRMLRTLLLNEYWCVPPDFLELACLLEHSPVLEKLTLQFLSEGSEHKDEIIGSYSPMEGSTAISKNLKIVEVKFEVFDFRLMEVLNFLQTLNIDFNFDKKRRLW